jgi:hypothetical protein
MIKSLASKLNAGAIGGTLPVALTSVKEVKPGEWEMSVNTKPLNGSPPSRWPYS